METEKKTNQRTKLSIYILDTIESESTRFKNRSSGHNFKQHNNNLSSVNYLMTTSGVPIIGKIDFSVGPHHAIR
jgi:hypothetical protein